MQHLSKLTKRLVFSLAVLSLAGFFIGKKFSYLAAEPQGEKDCPPLFPYPTDTSKPTNIRLTEQDQLLPWVQRGGTINDASCLDRTPVFGIIKVKSEEDIKNALAFAEKNKLKISVAGVRHSMGGQAFGPGALVLDMLAFNAVKLNEEEKTMTVQSGATWHDIQNYLHPKFSVKAMQSTDIFSVGGSISVNAHGMDHQAGSVGGTIRSMRVMLADGTIKTLSRTQNPELFRLVVGGYGLFGIILDAQIEVTENVVYQSERRIIDYTKFSEMFANEILPNTNYGLMYVHLSTAPHSFLKEALVYLYKKTDVGEVEIPPLQEVSSVKLRRLIINLSKYGPLAQRLKWFTEKYIEPKIESCSIQRAQAIGQGEACLVARNEPMHDSVPYLKNSLKNDTDILHEYFIPRDQFVAYVDGMREIFQRNHTNLLNASVRIVQKGENMLTYAPEDMYSLVLYINQTTDEAGNERMGKVTRELIDLTTKRGGRFFLPYQLHYSPEQLKSSYPQIADFFNAKQKYDPKGVFTSTFYEKYSKAI